MIKGKNALRSAAIRRAAGVVIEGLEQRKLMSTVTNHDIDNDGRLDIQVNGTSGTDRINVYLDPQLNQTFVWDNKNGNTTIDNGELKYFPELAGTVDITTGNGTDTVNVYLISDLGSGDQLMKQVQAAADLPVVESQGVSVYVDLGAGNDKFLFQSPTSIPDLVETAMCAAAGVNYVEMEGDGADLTVGGDLIVQVDGGNDKDLIDFDLSRTSIIGAQAYFTADAGSGDDTVNLTLPDFDPHHNQSFDDGEAGVVNGETYDYYSESFASVPSVLNVAIDLGSGKNIMNERIATNIMGGSGVHIDVDGGSSTDIINDVETFGTFDNVSWVAVEPLPIPISSGTSTNLTLDVELGGGDDTYNGVFDFSSFGIVSGMNGQAHFNIRGDDGKDTIKAKDSAGDQFPPTSDSIDVNGWIDFNFLGGKDNDNLQVDLDPGSYIRLGRTGHFSANVSGDAGNDFVRIDVAFATDSTGYWDLNLLGGSGDDKMGFMLQNLTFPNSPRQYGARGYALLDGGSGSDKWDTEGNGIFVKRGAEKEDDTIEPPFLGAP